MCCVLFWCISLLVHFSHSYKDISTCNMAFDIFSIILFAIIIIIMTNCIRASQEMFVCCCSNNVTISCKFCALLFHSDEFTIVYYNNRTNGQNCMGEKWQIVCFKNWCNEIAIYFSGAELSLMYSLDVENFQSSISHLICILNSHGHRHGSTACSVLSSEATGPRSTHDRTERIFNPMRNVKSVSRMRNLHKESGSFRRVRRMNSKCYLMNATILDGALICIVPPIIWLKRIKWPS